MLDYFPRIEHIKLCNGNKGQKLNLEILEQDYLGNKLNIRKNMATKSETVRTIYHQEK